MKTFNKTSLPEIITYNGNDYKYNSDVTTAYQNRPYNTPKNAVLVKVLSNTLKGKLDLHNQPYRPTEWIFTQVTENNPYADIVPKKSDKIEIGAIISSSWGYDQTNYDFYCVVKISGDFVTLIQMTKKIESGTKVTPTKIDLKKSPVRREFCRNATGDLYGATIDYGWANLWNGNAENATYGC